MKPQVKHNATSASLENLGRHTVLHRNVTFTGFSPSLFSQQALFHLFNRCLHVFRLGRTKDLLSILEKASRSALIKYILNSLIYLSQYLTNLMHKICFTISFISCIYMFRAHVLVTRRSKLHYTASGITTPIGETNFVHQVG